VKWIDRITAADRFAAVLARRETGGDQRIAVRALDRFRRDLAIIDAIFGVDLLESCDQLLLGSAAVLQDRPHRCTQQHEAIDAGR